MEWISLILLSVGLAMDAFAVSLCKGLAMGKAGPREALVVGLWFGGFQALMPAIGYFLGRSFYDLIADYDHWIAFFLLALIGANMIREGLSGSEEDMSSSLNFRIMLILAIATSIDALAVGITLSFEDGGIAVPAATIGIITLLISAAGVKIGSVFGDRFGSKAEIAGGIILILIGLRILLEHTGVI